MEERFSDKEVPKFNEFLNPKENLKKVPNFKITKRWSVKNKSTQVEVRQWIKVTRIIFADLFRDKNSNKNYWKYKVEIDDSLTNELNENDFEYSKFKIKNRSKIPNRIWVYAYELSHNKATLNLLREFIVDTNLLKDKKSQLRMAAFWFDYQQKTNDTDLMDFDKNYCPKYDFRQDKGSKNFAARYHEIVREHLKDA